jgi:ribosome modulation factor
MDNSAAIDEARVAMARIDANDVYGTMSRKLVEQGATSVSMEGSKALLLGMISRIILNEPGIVQRVRDEGFDARVAEKSIDTNPYHQDGTYGWWRQGWLFADENLGGVR